MSQSGGVFDVIVVGGGHNGLVAAGYLARAGRNVAVFEARDHLGGPCGTFEFLPGYRTAFTNSPGSLDPGVVADLELSSHGLEFVRPDPTLVHHFPTGPFLGWRDRGRVADQLDKFAAGEAARYSTLLDRLETLARQMAVSIYRPAPSVVEIARQLDPTADTMLFQAIVTGSLRALLDECLSSEEAKTLLAMVALNANLAVPSAPGTAIGLMLRPWALASASTVSANDPRRVVTRGSTGLPIGGMGAIIDALARTCERYGVTVHLHTPVTRIAETGGRVTGVVTEQGHEYHAPIVLATVPPKVTFTQLLDEDAVDGDLREHFATVPVRGSACKLVVAMDRLPRLENMPDDVSAEAVAGTQFRVASSLDYIEAAVADGLRGVPSAAPLMWGLIPSITSPGLAPSGRHLLSVNVWHGPYHLREGSWDTAGDQFAQTCIATLTEHMPDLPNCITDYRFMNPVELEAELGMVQANITHGDMLPDQLLGRRPHAQLNDYRTPLVGLYLSGAGTWPGGYVTGVPGYNASQVILDDGANACA